MTSITLDNEHRYEGDKVFVPIRIFGRSVELNVDMVLDTGAVLTVLNRNMIPVLGIEVETGEPLPIAVANKEVSIGYVHQVDIDFLGRAMRIPTVICPEWDMQNLLDMRGLFDQMVIAFDHAQKRIYF